MKGFTSTAAKSMSYNTRIAVDYNDAMRAEKAMKGIISEEGLRPS
jgi:hypothetical protein